MSKTAPGVEAITPKIEKIILKMKDEGRTVEDISKRVRISRSVIKNKYFKFYEDQYVNYMRLEQMF